MIGEKELKQIPAVSLIKLPFVLAGMVINPLKAISKLLNTYGDIVALSANPAIVFINDPIAVKHILKDNAENYSRSKTIDQPSYRGLFEMLGKGIFLSEGEDWRYQHNLIKSLFSLSAIAETFPVIDIEIKKLIEKWKVIKEPVFIEQEMHMLLLKIMLHTNVSDVALFNYRKISYNLEYVMRFSSLKYMMRSQMIASILNLFGMKYSLNSYKKKLEILRKIIEDLVDDLVGNKCPPTGLSKLLLQELREKRISKAEFRDQILNFLVAGFDTTAAAISWAMYHLSTNPHCQNKAKAELKESILLNPQTHNALRELPYLNSVVKETLRLHPVVWSIPRESIKADIINGFSLPAKSIIVISNYALHRNIKFWANGNEFNPLNFEKENFKGKHYAYIPFGQGARACIGRALAEYQIQLILSTLLVNFTFEIVDKVKPLINPEIIMRAKKPLRLKMSFND
jgi:cytochrome P450